MNTRLNKNIHACLKTKKNAKVAALLMSAVSAAPALAQITIAQMETDANNTPNQTMDTSTISALVSQGGGLVSDGYTYTNWSFLANDGTGSLDVFGKMPTGSTYIPTVGDEITATGTYFPFRNTPELETLTAITKVGTASSIPSPTVVTIPQLLQLANTGTSSNSNAIQGYLLQLNDVTFSGLQNQTAGNTPESVMTQHANNQWTATDSSENSVLIYQYASSYSVSGALALQNGGAIPTTPQDIIGLAQVYNGTAEFIPLSYSNSTNVAPPPPANKTVLTPSPFASQAPQGSATSAGILSVSTSGGTKTVTANVGTYVNVGYASSPKYEFATIPNQSVITPLLMASSGGTAGTDSTYYAIVPNGAHGGPANNYPIPTGQTGTANIGFSATDTGASAGTTLSGSLQITNSDNLSDSAINVSVNATSPLHVLAQRDVTAGSSTYGAFLGDVLVGATAMVPGITLSTVNTNTGGDYTSNTMTNVTLLANSTSAAYTIKDPFTGNSVATVQATTPAYDQVFGGSSGDPFSFGVRGAWNNGGTETSPLPGGLGLAGTVNVSITPAISGTYGDGHSATVGSTSETYDPNYISFQGAAEGVVGMGLPYENESVYVYGQFTGFQPASVSSSGSVASGVTLTNAATSDNVATEGSSTGNFGVRASAWVSSLSGNQDGWSTNATAATPGSPDTPGTTIAGSGSIGDTSSHSTNVSFSYNPAVALAGAYSGGTYTIGLENAETDDQNVVDQGYIQGTSHNDLAPVTVPLPNETGTDTTGAGTYNFGGGTFVASGVTHLTGSFTQSGGSSTFNQITGSGSMLLLGGTTKLAKGHTVSTLASLSMSSVAQLDITNNTLDVTSGNFGALTILVGAGYASGAWTGSGITSSSAASTPGTAVGIGLSGSTVVIKYTWYGDLNLDGTVDSADLALMGTGSGWAHGDLNYDGTVNQDDYALYMLGAAEAGSKNISSVPEPTLLSAVVLPAMIGLRRRRRA